MDQGTTRETPGDPGGFLGQLEREWQPPNDTLRAGKSDGEGGAGLLA